MRHHLLKTFDDIYIVDLHGNADKRETTPAGCPDFNVFDIMEGVSIIIAARYSNSTRHLANLYHCDLWGTRKEKYDFLFENKLSSMNFQKLNYREPHYFFLPKNFKGQEDYFEGFCINDLFKSSSMGVTTGKDKERVSFSKIDSELLKRYSYRPFDIRNIIYDTQNLARSRETVMRNFYKANVALISCKRNRDDNSTFFVSNQITDKSIISSLDNSYCFPLYLYQNDMGEEQKVPNFSPEIYNKIKSTIPNVTPEGLFDYVYAVLHSSIYRERYAEFLKIDFPRIPYPDNSAIFKTLAKKGAELRGLHLMESGTLDDLITTYPEAGNNEVQAIGRNSYRDGNVYINDNQYFGGVSEIAWNFYIGGYQPAQKWLKDRKGRTLGVDDIMHYQRMIVALVNTDRIMKEIDEIKFLPEKEQAEE